MRPLLLAKCAVYAAIAIAPMPGKAHALFVDGNTLYGDCTNTGNGRAFASGYCLGYIVAATDGIEFSDVYFRDRERCWSATVTQGQMRDVVVNYLRDHPEKRHLSATTSIRVAVQSAFCTE